MPYCSNCGTAEAPDQRFCANCGRATSGPFVEPGALPYFPPELFAVEGPPYANYWWRVLGYSIDLAVVTLLISLPLGAAIANRYELSVVSSALIFAYGTLLLVFAKGRTVGMGIVRIHCANESDLSRISPVQAIKRTALYCALNLLGTLYHYVRYVDPTQQQKNEMARHAGIEILFLVPFLVDLLWPLWDKRKQTLHDKFARTVVIRPRSGHSDEAKTIR